MRSGIDLGGTKIQAVVVDDAGEVLGETRVPTPRDGGPPGVAAAMGEAVEQAAGQAGGASGGPGGGGGGSPGVVDDKAGTVARAGNLPDWEEPYPLRDVLAKDVGTKVRLGNDVTVATDGEIVLGAGE